MTAIEQFVSEELERALLQGGRDMEYLLFIDAARNQADWSMRLTNLVGIIERARDAQLTEDEIRTAVAMGLFPEFFGIDFD
jgi:hypothetical protein